MQYFLLIVAVIIICFGFVIIFGAPYLPTLTPQVTAALDLADLKPGQTLLELGCGDGKVLIAAAERGWRVVGYELNPLLAVVAWLRTRRYNGRVKVICGNFWRQQWPPSDAIFVFLLDAFMPRLDARLRALRRPVKLVSFAFQIPNRQPLRQVQGVYLYQYE